MAELPRSQSLVRLDGPGHILPIEPVTPPDSSVWRVVHFPLILVLVALGLLTLAEIAAMLVTQGVGHASYFPGARFIAPTLSAAAVIAVYWVFVRRVERRRDIVEFGGRAWLQELGLGFVGGLLLSSGIILLLIVLGGARIVGLNAPATLVQPLVLAICAGFVQEIILRGLFFRLVERLLGSWSALLVTALLFGGAYMATPAATPMAALAVALEAGLLLAAVYMVTRRLWAAVGLHAAWNFAQGGLYGVTIGGPEGFVRVQVGGPDWLTGGGFGAAASLPAILLTALFVIILLTMAVRRGRIVRPIWQQRRTG